MPEIIVYTKTVCVQCRATFNALDKDNIPYRKVDISEDAEAREFVMALGYLQAPVVYAGPDNHFGGFRPDRLKSLASIAAA